MDTIEEYGRVIKKRNYWPKTYWKRQNPKDVGDLDLPGSWRIMWMEKIWIFWMTLNLQKTISGKTWKLNSIQNHDLITLIKAYMFINVCTTLKMTCGIKIWISKAKFFLVGKFYWHRLHYFLTHYIIRQGGVGLLMRGWLFKKVSR